ncbi:MAG: TetR/AcrR family transcriptional regulator [Cyanobacteria bacterium SBLK]|nr:TetR/AcrR family transcriptional regulator [Cyanobacteria bacterium SBLK]
MSSKKLKLTKAEQTARTRRAILDRARELFMTKGYGATGTEEIIADLGITRGALYHQFGSKQGVFRAVIEEAYQEIARYIETQAMQVEEPWERLMGGSHAFLEIAHREDIRRLVFIEAPAMLDADTLAQCDRQYGYGLLVQAIQAVVDAGELEVPDVEGFTMMINGALEYLANWIMQIDSPERLEMAKTLTTQLLTLYRKP